MKFYMFRTVPLPIIRSLFTVHSAMLYVIQVCRQFSSRIILPWNSTCFGQFLCPSAGVYSLYTQQCYTGLQTAFEQDHPGMKIYMFRTVYVNEFHPGPARKLSANLYDIYHCWVYREWTPDDRQKNCPKHVEFHARVDLWNWCI